ncbi:MAG: nucleotidyltransferase domain-containing protein [Chloroflexota bacterium]|nr:nucleotidyltransferase domain-containing protein [Chloroflexota bacterium]
MSLAEHLSEKVQERTDLIKRVSSILHSDERVVAAWLGGSLGSGNADAYSDVDLWVVVRDSDIEGMREGRRQFVEVLGSPVLISEAPQNAPPGGAYLWTLYAGKHGPQHVDWSWLPETGATIPADARLLFDKVGLTLADVSRRVPPTGEDLCSALSQECAFFWGMCGVVAKYIARGRAYDVLNLLNLVASTSDKIKWLLGEGELKSYKENLWDEVPLTTEPQDQLGLLRKLASEMEFGTGPKVEAAGGQVPHQAIVEIHNLLALVECDLESTQEHA